MGYIRNHAIVVSDHGHGDYIQGAHAKAVSLSLCVTPIIHGKINGVRSFAVLSDGSKEGWSESDVADAGRDGLVDYLRSLYYDDGSSPISWAELQYGDDENVTVVIRSSDDDYNERRRTVGERHASDEVKP